MLLVSSREVALGFMVIGIIFLGTWPAVWNYVERKGRHPSHTFIDYGIFYVLCGWVICFALGESGPTVPGVPDIADQIKEDNGNSVAFAIVGGFILSIGNICMQYSVALLGLSVGMPFICALTIVVGVSLNYRLDSGLNDARILFPGTACAAIAIIVGGLAHIENQKHLARKRQQQLEQGMFKDTSSTVDLEVVTEDPAVTKDAQANAQAPQPVTTPGTKITTEEFMSANNPNRAIKAGNKQWWLGCIFAGISGICISLFSPAFNVASNDPFLLLPPGVTHMSVYLTNFWFAMGFGIGAIGINIILLYYPLLEGTPKSSLTAYVKDWRLRPLAMLAGFFCSAGNLAEFIGGQAAGYAAAAMVQAFPLVATLWGVLLFREFWGTSRKAIFLLVTEVCFYIAAMALLGASAKARS